MGVAQRGSINRPAGAPVWRNTVVTREVYRDLLIEKLLPAIALHWPGDTQQIRIQQDGARVHLLEGDPEWEQALEWLQMGIPIRLFTQPSNSPDLNICDLGFFRAVEAANNHGAMNESEIITQVEQAYNNYPANLINRIWLTWMSVCDTVIIANGSNNYQLTHMRKAVLERLGILPHVLELSAEAVAAAAWYESHEVAAANLETIAAMDVEENAAAIAEV
jgi:hypothetical protein